jgi:anti-anti-sigma factor
MDLDIQNRPVIVTHVGDGFKLAFRGPIHVNTAWLESELDKVVLAKPKTVELDLAGTEYISSLGLGILVSFNRRIVENGGLARIIKIRKMTLGVLRASRLDGVLRVEPSTEIVTA